MTDHCVLCGALNPAQWRYRNTDFLQRYCGKYCKEGPFVWPAVMQRSEPRSKVCVSCVYQLRKRFKTHYQSPALKQMLPMDAYLLWLYRMNGSPDRRQMQRLRHSLAHYPNVYSVMAGEPVAHITDERSWDAYNIHTEFYRHSETVSRLRRVFK